MQKSEEENEKKVSSEPTPMEMEGEENRELDQGGKIADEGYPEMKKIGSVVMGAQEINKSSFDSHENQEEGSEATPMEVEGEEKKELGEEEKVADEGYPEMKKVGSVEKLRVMGAQETSKSSGDPHGNQEKDGIQINPSQASQQFQIQPVETTHDDFEGDVDMGDAESIETSIVAESPEKTIEIRQKESPTELRCSEIHIHTDMNDESSPEQNEEKVEEKKIEKPKETIEKEDLTQKIVEGESEVKDKKEDEAHIIETPQETHASKEEMTKKSENKEKEATEIEAAEDKTEGNFQERMAMQEEDKHQEEEKKAELTQEEKKEKPKEEEKEEEEEKIDFSSLEYYLNSFELQHEHNLLSLKYYYNPGGELKHIHTKESFKFTNQTHYEELCIAMISYIQALLKTHFQMEELFLPLSLKPKSSKPPKSPKKPQSNIFLSKDFYKNKNACLLLIQGTGPVRAGIWARYCCMNESLHIGSVFSFIEKAKSLNMSSIVFNPNLNRDPVTKEPIPQNSSMSEHCNYVWENVLKKCPAMSYYMIAHSAGGHCASELLRRYEKNFLVKVKCVALTDSWMSARTEKGGQFLWENVAHFVASGRPMGDMLGRSQEIMEYSAGHHRHEYTTGCAYDAIFQFFEFIMQGKPFRYIPETKQVKE